MLDPVQTALAIRRGAFKLANVPQDERPLVAAVLARMTDAQAGILAHKQERRRQSLGRSHAFGWKAGS